jgi:hypothetical protein
MKHHLALYCLVCLNAVELRLAEAFQVDSEVVPAHRSLLLGQEAAE